MSKTDSRPVSKLDEFINEWLYAASTCLSMESSLRKGSDLNKLITAAESFRLEVLQPYRDRWEK